MLAADNDGLPFAFRVKEACNKLSISRSTLYEEIAAGRLQAVKCGTRTLIPTAAMDAWLKNLPAKAA
jgi:excisionase family DNA binding protein